MAQMIRFFLAVIIRDRHTSADTVESRVYITVSSFGLML